LDQTRRQLTPKKQSRAPKNFLLPSVSAKPFDAYSDAFTRFSASVTPERQAASRPTAPLTPGDTPMPVVSGCDIYGRRRKSKAEAMFNLALAYGRSKQWAAGTRDDRRAAANFPNSTWTTRAFVQVGQAAEDAKKLRPTLLTSIERPSTFIRGPRR